MSQPLFRKRWLSAAIALAACSSSAFAQEADQDSSDLPVVRVVGEAISEPTTEDTGSYTSNRVTIGKQGLSLKETPQSVSVITRERMNDQNMTTLDDVLTRTTGITKRDFGPTASVYLSRGYEIDTMLLDGTPIDSAIGVTDTMFDTAVLDRLEVLRGSFRAQASPVVPSIWRANAPRKSSAFRRRYRMALTTPIAVKSMSPERWMNLADFVAALSAYMMIGTISSTMSIPKTPQGMAR